MRYWNENLLQGPPPAEPFPALAGITVHLTFARRAFELAGWFRSRGVRVVLGGLHVLSRPDECAPHADTLAMGEGVQIWPRIRRDFERGRLQPRYCGIHSMHGMGTKVVIAHIHGSRAYIGSVGDGRAYLVRDGALRQLTSDHTLVNEQVRVGALSRQEARRHPARNILTRAVGSQEEVEPDLVQEDLRPGGLLLLCSDGLTTMVEDGDILKTVLAHQDDPAAVCSLSRLKTSASPSPPGPAQSAWPAAGSTRP